MCADRFLVVVDGYSTGRFVPREATTLDTRCIHVKSSAQTPDFFDRRFDPTQYAENFVFSGDVTGLIRSIQARGEVAGVICGVDTGTEVRDLLAAGFGCAGNAPISSQSRRDKIRMADALRTSGIRSIRHIVCDAQSVATISPESLGGYPLIVKPACSAGTDGVVLCRSAAELDKAIASQLGRPNALGALNTRLLLQEYIVGTEYIVNTVSVDGSHYALDAWRCDKVAVNGHVLYDLETLLEPDDEVFTLQLLPYLRSALTALGVEHGPAHSELLIDASGPVLIETGARLHGSIDPDVVSRCIGWNHAAASVLAALRPEEFLRTHAQFAARLRNFERCFCVALIAHESGRVLDDPGVRAIKQLPTCRSSAINVNVGDYLESTRDLLTSPGIVYLTDASSEQLANDYSTIRRIEQSGLFKTSEHREMAAP